MDGFAGRSEDTGIFPVTGLPMTPYQCLRLYSFQGALSCLISHTLSQQGTDGVGGNWRSGALYSGSLQEKGVYKERALYLWSLQEHSATSRVKDQ